MVDIDGPTASVRECVQDSELRNFGFWTLHISLTQADDERVMTTLLITDNKQAEKSRKQHRSGTVEAGKTLPKLALSSCKLADMVTRRESFFLLWVLLNYFHLSTHSHYCAMRRRGPKGGGCQSKNRALDGLGCLQ